MRTRSVLMLPLVLALLPGAPAPAAEQPSAGVQGPFSSTGIGPLVWNGDLRDLPQSHEELRETEEAEEFRLTPMEQKALAEARAAVRRPAAPFVPGPVAAPMPAPIANFAALNLSANGSGWPPDTNGDVGPNHYIQTVNSSIGIYNKSTGALISAVTLNTFFQGPAGTPCDTSNDGDPVVLYDASVDRWIVTDFAWTSISTGPFYECIAVSQSGDPVSGGWYYYAMQASTGAFAGYLNDYPKLGVWPDAYYMATNMFQEVPAGSGFGVRLWAINKTPLLTGAALQEVHFDLCTDGSCGSFLPSNQRGTAPPAGAPNYFMQVSGPGTNTADLYRFHADFAIPANSTLTGPIQIPVAPSEMVAFGVPQSGTTSTLDSLSFRLMAQLQYRNFGTHQALFATHTIDEGGIASARWYEFRDPAGTPTLYQQGTHKLPDGSHRWMGSVAADKDGNVALGYSVSSGSTFPSIRYAGRRAGEALGTLPQTERTLFAGTGSQSGVSRWGDYSALSVDPSDDCTFWYTQEYYAATGTNWQTRVGSFKFPACGQSLGTLAGQVRDSVTNAGIPGAPVTVAGTETLSSVSDAGGNYSLQVLPGTYSVTAGPLAPGYPAANTISGNTVVAAATTTVNVPLVPAPNLVYTANVVADPGPLGNNNGYAEPGETVQLTITLNNNGAATSTGISAVLSSSDANVTVSQNTSAYSSINPGASAPNTTAYQVALSPSLVCGTIVQFQLAVTTAQGPYTLNFSLQASIPQPLVSAYSDNFESGVNGWTTGGTSNQWAQTTSQSQSPTHSWTDSPAGSYPNNMNSWLQSPVINLSAKTGVTVSSWVRYALEAGYDYAYLEYSLDGGTTWSPTWLARWNGVNNTWTQSSLAAPALDNQANVRLRYRVTSDGGVVDDGLYVDTFDVEYRPIVCQPVPVELQSFAVE